MSVLHAKSSRMRVNDIIDLHSVWDSRLISKSLRTVAQNYTRPLPSRQVESALRGTIYDPYIREIMWEGVMGAWKDELEDWLSCPEDISPLPTNSQTPFILSPATGMRVLNTASESICPFAWAQPIHQLNCDIIWPASLDQPEAGTAPRRHYVELDTAEYSGMIKEKRVVEKLLATAGIRLAGVLNQIFADRDQNEIEQ